MDKIPFKDGNLVKKGYITIDGIQYEAEPAEYTGEVPLSAYNLNKMQDNMEKATIINQILLQGNSIQMGTPSIENEALIKSAGDNSSIEIKQDNGLETTDINCKSQTKTLNTQKPFRSIGETRDKFINKGGIWYEEHNIARKDIDGTENFTYSNHVEAYQYRTANNFLNDLLVTPDPFNLGGVALSNYFIKLQTANALKDLGFTLSGNKQLILNTNFETVAELKNWLQEKKAGGNPLSIYYKLATPELIECTYEQTEILNDIYSAYAEGMINIYSSDEVSPIIEIVEESKEIVQANNNIAISNLLKRVLELEAKLTSNQGTEDGGA